jgi:tellurite resistance protein TerA
MQKVSLTKAQPTVSLTKTTGASGIMRVNLNWNAQAAPPPAGGGFFKRQTSSGAVDLDLGCLFELADGTKGVVQALGNTFGSTDRAPWIKLDGDDRSGAVSGGENLLINLDKLDQLKRVLVFAYIYEGVPAWDKADGVVTLHPVGAGPIEVLLDDTSNTNFCAVALLENVGGQLRVNREVKFVQGSQRTLDELYGWGMNWQSARK